jgi:hypothetical protein
MPWKRSVEILAIFLFFWDEMARTDAKEDRENGPPDSHNLHKLT